MISFVEGPYHDEPLFGFLARICARIKGPTRSQFRHHLFGNKRAITHFDFPNYLSALEDSIGTRIGFSGADLIERTTMVPVIAPFFPSDRLLRIRAAMINDKKPAASSVMWRRESSPDGKRRLRFCLQCRQHDLTNNPHTWWRRTHQVPGVVCCPDHGISLSVSQFVDGDSWKQDYPMADDAVEIATTHKPDALDRFVSSGIQRLLNHKIVLVEDGALRDVFMERLTKVGLTKSGQLRRTVFLESFFEQRPAAVWEERNLTFDPAQPSAWPAQIAMSKSNHRSPVMHLILMKFLGLSVEEFIFEALSPDRVRHPSRLIVNNSERDRRVMRLWDDPGKTLQDICREAGMCRDRLLSLCRKLKLEVPRKADVLAWRKLIKKRREFRKIWVSGPHLPLKDRTRIRMWLSRYDRPWLHAHLAKKTMKHRRIDWAAREQFLLSQLPYVIAKIRSQRPFRRVSKTALLEMLPFGNSSQHRMHLMPLLHVEIKNREEQRKEFTLRRIQTIRQSAPRMSPWKVREEASVPRECRDVEIMTAMGYKLVGSRWLVTPEMADRAGYGLMMSPKKSTSAA